MDEDLLDVDTEDIVRALEKERGSSGRIAGLTPTQLEHLAKKVYLLLRQELAIERERHGWRGGR